MPVKSTVKLSTLSHVILYVKDTKRSIDFYQAVLGTKVKLNEDGWVELDTGSTTLALHVEGEKTGTSGSTSTVVFAVDNVKQTYKDLKSAGVKFKSEPHQVCEAPDALGFSADFQDPDGNSLSIFGMVKK